MSAGVKTVATVRVVDRQGLEHDVQAVIVSEAWAATYIEDGLWTVTHRPSGMWMRSVVEGGLPRACYIAAALAEHHENIDATDREQIKTLAHFVMTLG